MDKYEKLFKGLEMCAGPDCNPECPYHGETRGGKTCRAWLLDDAAVALAHEESRAEGFAGECEYLRERMGGLNEPQKQKESEVGLADAVKVAMQAIRDAEYWHGQADALKWFLHDRFDECTVEERVDVTVEPEVEADDHV